MFRSQLATQNCRVFGNSVDRKYTYHPPHAAFVLVASAGGDTGSSDSCRRSSSCCCLANLLFSLFDILGFLEELGLKGRNRKNMQTCFHVLVTATKLCHCVHCEWVLRGMDFVLRLGRNTFHLFSHNVSETSSRRAERGRCRNLCAKKTIHLKRFADLRNETPSLISNTGDR